MASMQGTKHYKKAKPERPSHPRDRRPGDGGRENTEPESGPALSDVVRARSRLCSHVAAITVVR
eukprot:6192188-Pleurochrysis_carterae.AAC.1